jgi:hypothetical protein
LEYGDDAAQLRVRNTSILQFPLEEPIFAAQLKGTRFSFGWDICFVGSSAPTVASDTYS